MNSIRRVGTKRSAKGSNLPSEVGLLPRREREIATLVYEHRALTAKQVQLRLSDNLTNASVRSMLNRLVDKGLLKRIRQGPLFVYQPALTPVDSQRRALKQFADDYFRGSVEEAAAMITRLLQAPPAVAVSNRRTTDVAPGDQHAAERQAYCQVSDRWLPEQR